MTLSGTKELFVAEEVPPSVEISSNVDVEIEGESFAKLYGEPVLKLPNDLYIPPDALEILLDAFEGPLDLLLYLIRRQNLDVLDIPMAQVTDQYLSYVEQVRSKSFELAAEYLLMAAMLIEIKSRMLLPVKKADTEEEIEDPRAELVRRLLEYEQMKLAAYKIDELPQLDRDFFTTHVAIQKSVRLHWPSVSTDDLCQAWSQVLQRARLNQRHTITHESLSVREFMTKILRQLQNQRFIEFTDLFDDAIKSARGVDIVVVHFIALLELVREMLVEITQVEPFAPIYICLTHSSSEAIIDTNTDQNKNIMISDKS